MYRSIPLSAYRGMRGLRRGLGCACNGQKRLGEFLPWRGATAGLLVGPSGLTSKQLAALAVKRGLGDPTLGPFDEFRTAGPIDPSVFSSSPFANPNTVMTLASNPNALQIAQNDLSIPFQDIQASAIQGVNVPGSSAANSTNPSGIASYLPWIVLGIGGVVLISAVKKR